MGRKLCLHRYARKSPNPTHLITPMTKIPTIEETLDEVEKNWDTDRTEATRAIMRYASGQRTALLTELRDSEILEEDLEPTWGDGYNDGIKIGHNTLAKAIKAHLDELIKLH